MTVGKDEPVDLTNCEREPIHRLGKIQPFGALLAVSVDGIVVHRSANCAAILGSAKPIESGDPLAAHFSTHAIELLRERLGAIGPVDAVERVFGLDLAGNGTLFDVALHQSGRSTVIEFEPHDAAGMIEHTRSLRPVMAALDDESGVVPLCAEAARQMKRLLGFDRVMVYRFHADLSGEVVAEAREPQLESFLNLRYPASDIPAQARELYKRNLFRIISDVNAEPVPIEPETSLDGEPLDLSHSTLRAVSPIHIEYLKNMGVGASLSISIVIRGELWGLFACHHYGPRVLPFSQRTVAELFSQLFSLQLSREIADAGSVLAEQGRRVHDRLMSRLAGGEGLVENLATIDEVIGRVIAHDGSSAFIDGVYNCRGKCPDEEQFRALVPALNTTAASQIFATDSLPALIPQAQAFADRAVGALVIPVSRRPRDYIVLWRSELPQVVTWAGNPQKPVEVGPHGDRLTPRKSFEAWQESVSGKSKAWTEEERRVAESLRITLLEVILRLTDEAVEERARAQEQQELLIAELNHRVRNILALIRGLINQSKADATDIAAFVDIVGGRVRALSIAHDNITREHWSPTSLKELIAAEAEAYLSGLEGRISVTGDDVLIMPSAYTTLALVLHEMMTNSVKYGSLCDRRGELAIALSRGAEGALHIAWRESGGPKVAEPKRRGFGSTLVERSIPFELKGSVDLRFEETGLEADFTIPAEFVREPRARPTVAAGDTGESASAPGETANRPQRVLVVEDSMIIALDAEECLRRLGIDDVALASSVAGALNEIDKKPPQFALLDYNLGDETSARVAARLSELEVPFFYASGYGEGIDDAETAAALGVLKKPYGRDDIAAALDAAFAKS